MEDNPSDGDEDHNEGNSGVGEDIEVEDESDEEEQQFDKTLAASHSVCISHQFYLGANLELDIFKLN
ncbi:unnamed protein product [Parnassius mnemosyne]|uniref:Uncharacterized protein n=1 Tax=Parnassius mnemosyne TaxID=213953 RepID=A0AAV1L5T5_9NEOP